MAEEPKVAIRQKTFLKGTLYYDNRRASIECVIRNISDSGARLTFDQPTVVPENVELFIPHRQQTLPARVRRRGPNEVGIAFENERLLEPRRTSDAELQQRVETLEAEITALKKLVAKLKAKVLPHDLDAA
jgi:PilZ domain